MTIQLHMLVPAHLKLNGHGWTQIERDLWEENEHSQASLKVA